MATRVKVGKDFRNLFQVIYSYIYSFMDSSRRYAAHNPASVKLTIEGKESPKLSRPADTCFCHDLFGVFQMRDHLLLARIQRPHNQKHRFLPLKKDISGSVFPKRQCSRLHADKCPVQNKKGEHRLGDCLGSYHNVSIFYFLPVLFLQIWKLQT